MMITDDHIAPADFARYAPQNISSLAQVQRPAAGAAVPAAGGDGAMDGRKPIELAETQALKTPPESGGCQRATRRLAVCLDHMRAHLDQPIKISTLSALAKLSNSRFFSLFRQATNDTPLNWIIRARMERAVELLAHTSLPIKQIAGRVGYPDPLYFSRMFKSVQGMPPSEYRLTVHSPRK
jgi:AraC-like DNA-binding protein